MTGPPSWLLRARRWVALHPRISGVLGLLGVGLLGSTLVWDGAAMDQGMTTITRRGTLSATLTATGILRPVQSITYRSPLAGRETEVMSLVSEGTHVGEGDLLVRLDSATLERDLERSRQEVRQLQVELQVAEIEVQEGQAAIDSLSAGEAALTVEETQTRLALAQKRVDRLQQEHDSLVPLMAKGFITREELRKTSDELEQAEEDVALARRRTEVLIGITRPRDRQRAELQLAQKEAQRENVRTRLGEARARAQVLDDQFGNSSLYARRPGIVVYEEYLSANPRRKIRVGDRVTESQGLVTIPEVDQMLVEASVGEADVQRLRPGQQATVILEAFRDRPLSGKVTRVGALARSSAERPFEDRRFDLIVELDQTNVDLRPEMTARVDVHLGDRRDVLLLPVNAIFERQGLPVVHVIRGLGSETRPVHLGQSSDSLVEVVQGLVEGERVALTDAASSPPSAPASTGGRQMLGNADGGRGLLAP